MVQRTYRILVYSPMKPETSALLLRLTEAQMDCQGPTDTSVNTHYYVYPVEGQTAHSSLCECKGTGKVPLFPDTVREECPRCSGRGRIYGGAPTEDGYICPDCKGRGEVPSTDPMVWIKDLYRVLSFVFEYQRARWSDEVWVCWINYQKALLHGNFDAAISHAVKAMKLAGILEVANEPAS